MTLPELSRPFPLERLSRLLTLTVEADAAECVAIACRLRLPAVTALCCDWTLQPEPRGAVAAHGVLRAQLEQECVVSLDAFPVAITEGFSVRFVPAGEESEDADDPDLPDELPYEGAVLDLGEATVEQLALALDPYPRKPGAILPEEAADEAVNPFAALARRRAPE